MRGWGLRGEGEGGGDGVGECGCEGVGEGCCEQGDIEGECECVYECEREVEAWALRVEA